MPRLWLIWWTRVPNQRGFTLIDLVIIITIIGIAAAIVLESNPLGNKYVRCGEQEWHGVSLIEVKGQTLTFYKDNIRYAVPITGQCEWGYKTVDTHNVEE